MKGREKEREEEQPVKYYSTFTLYSIFFLLSILLLLTLKSKAIRIGTLDERTIRKRERKRKKRKNKNEEKTEEGEKT